MGKGQSKSMTVTTEPQSKEIEEGQGGKVGKIEEAGLNGEANHESNEVSTNWQNLHLFYGKIRDVAAIKRLDSACEIYANTLLRGFLYCTKMRGRKRSN